MPRRRSREASIIEAAAKLFRQRGYQGTTMDDVADAVSLNKGTLYYYFAGKSDLLERIYSESVDIVLDAFAEHGPDLTPTERVRRIIDDLANAVDKRPNHTVVYLQEMEWLDQWLPRAQFSRLRSREERMRAYVVTTIADGIKAGEFADRDPFVAAMGILGMVCWTYRWYRPSGPMSIEEIGATFGDLALAGLIADA